MKTIEPGSVVTAHLTGRLDNNEVFDSSEGGPPVELKVGSGVLIRAFEEALLGMGPGERKRFTIPAAAAYGPRDEKLERSFTRSELPPGYRPRAGDIIAIEVPGGPARPARIKQVNRKGVVADLNHPLAGQDLTYEVEIVDVQPGSEPKSTPRGKE